VLIRRGSFGYGGTNAHVIVEDARGYLQARGLGDSSEALGTLDTVMESLGKVREDSKTFEDISSDEGSFRAVGTPDTSEPVSADDVNVIDPEDRKVASTRGTDVPKSRLYVLSAYDEDTGKEYLTKLRDHLGEEPVDENGPFMTNLAETLNKHRSLLPWKTSMIASSLPQLILGLQHARFTHATKPPSVGFVFTGQGAQWHAMARSLLHVEKFRKSLDLSNEVLESLRAGWSVMEELCKDESSTRVNEAILSQPLCTIIQIALVDLLRSWNIIPTAVVGHSSGEIAAAYAAGAVSLKGAVTTAYYRGLVVGTEKQKGTPIKGAMAAVRSTQSEVAALLSQLQTGTAHIACHNSPQSFTVSGDESAIIELIDLCSSKEVWARKLLVDVAYHSPKMQPVAEEYRTALLAASMGSDLSQKPSCEQFSSVTGRKLQSNDVTPDYWVENMTKPVLFSDALLEMCTKSKGRASTQAKNISSIDVLIEIGPHGALAGPVREIIQSQPALAKISYLSALNRQEDAVDTVLKLASRLFERGYSVDIQAINHPIHQEHPPILVNLPSYPWNHSTRYWAEPRVHMDYRLRKWPRHDLLGAPVKFSNALEPRWRNWIRLSELPWLRDHRVQSLVSLTFYISLCATSWVLCSV
jgi:acyl transferase domain-containing protein